MSTGFRPRPAAAAGCSRRSGMSLIWMLITFTVLTGFVSLGVDLARVHLVKTEMQRSADAAAHFGAVSLGTMSDATLKYWVQQVGVANPADGLAVAFTAADIEFVHWNKTTRVATAVGTSAAANAVRVNAHRTAARGTSVPMLWGWLVGKNGIDVKVTATACLTPSLATTVTINANQADPYLAGMPPGSTASYNDTAPNNSPPALNVPLVPGSYLTFGNAFGAARHGPTQPDDGPDGSTSPSKVLLHGIDSPGGSTPAAENGIGGIRAPLDAILGVFLGADQPNLTAAPATRDYSTSASRDRTVYDDIQAKQPFFIGDGLTSGGTAQQFKVPDGATRLFIGTMDGHEWGNNMGSFSITVHTPRSVSLVQ